MEQESGGNMNRDKEILDLFLLVEELHKIDPGRYTSLSFSIGNADNKRYEQWNIYTHAISHNSFSELSELAVFIKKILESGHKNYNAYKIKECEEKIRYHKDILESQEDELLHLKSNL